MINWKLFLTSGLIVAAVILFSAGLFSCSRPDKSPEELVIGLESEPERLSPVTIKNPQTFRVAWQIYEGLLGLDENGEIVPRIAKSWETDDNKVWTFHIREGMNFHQSEIFGNPSETRSVTAHDVHYSYTRFCSPGAFASFVLADSIKGCAAYNAGNADEVEGLRVIDDYTFQIELNKPEPFFVNRITSPWISIFPEEAEKDEFKDQWGLTMAVGTGPYQLLSKSDNEIVLEKNEKYWDEDRIPQIHRIVFRVIRNDQVRFTELRNKRIDLMLLPSQLFSTVFDRNGEPQEQYKENFNLKETRTFNTHLIGINMERVPDVHLRRAMFFGVDRDEMVQKILYGHADIIGGATPPGMHGYESPFENLHAPERAAMELAKSQYQGERINLLVHDLANSELIGQLFQNQMKDIGINIELTKLDFDSTIGRMVRGDVQLFSTFAEVVFSSPEPLLLNLFSSTKRPAPNFWHYSNPEIDDKLEGLRDIDDRAESLKASADIEKAIMDEVPAIFLYRQKQIIMFSNRFNELMVNGHDHFMLEKMRIKE